MNCENWSVKERFGDGSDSVKSPNGLDAAGREKLTAITEKLTTRTK